MYDPDATHGRDAREPLALGAGRSLALRAEHAVDTVGRVLAGGAETGTGRVAAATAAQWAVVAAAAVVACTAVAASGLGWAIGLPRG